MTMTSKERVERIINFKEADRVAFNFWMDRCRMQELDQKYGANFRVSHFDADVVESFPLLDFPHGRFETSGGINWLAEPLFASYDQVAGLKMPDSHDPQTYAMLEADLKQYPDKAVICDMGNVLSISEMMRSQVDLYMDMMTCPEGVTELFTRISDVLVDTAHHVCRMGITALYVMDDCACNKGLLISPAHLRELVLPHWKKVIDVGHSYGKPVFFHSDGNLESIWDVFVDELKVRMLNPLQPNLQDIGLFKKKYHGKTGIYGGIDTGRVHEMNPDQIRRHVRELFEKSGADGGLIISTHDIDYSVTDDQLHHFVAAIKDCTY